MIRLNSILSLEQVIQASAHKPVVIFKHSIACGISARARMRLGDLTQTTDPDIYELVVQESRELSREIAARFGIKHESPQAIVLYRKRPIFHTSHGKITPDTIRKVVSDTERNYSEELPQ